MKNFPGRKILFILLQDLIDAHKRDVKFNYGGSFDVRKAVKKVSSMRPDNPLRNIGYVVGILRNEARD